jgi:hypothetical protein
MNAAWICQCLSQTFQFATVSNYVLFAWRRLENDIANTKDEKLCVWLRSAVAACDVQNFCRGELLPLYKHCLGRASHFSTHPYFPLLHFLSSAILSHVSRVTKNTSLAVTVLFQTADDKNCSNKTSEIRPFHKSHSSTYVLQWQLAWLPVQVAESIKWQSKGFFMCSYWSHFGVLMVILKCTPELQQTFKWVT